LLAAVLRAQDDPLSGSGELAVIGTAAAAGLLDDLKGDASAKGLKGHLRSLRHGQVTTGLVKLAAVGAAAVLFAATNRSTQRRGRLPRRLAAMAVDAVVVAGAANLANLLDLRPGRALKAVGAPAVLLAVAPGKGGELAAGITGAVVAAAPSDLEERTMLGDCGANALGAALGVALVRSLPPTGRLALAGAIGGLILASERISFSRVIAGHPVLRRLDELGREQTG
jgi:UDP-N-acetylmuramyl pentapeptide phosphotransferase/UDP-N-acetylglucosamine-1-phosphate transferase